MNFIAACLAVCVLIMRVYVHQQPIALAVDSRLASEQVNVSFG